MPLDISISAPLGMPEGTPGGLCLLLPWGGSSYAACSLNPHPYPTTQNHAHLPTASPAPLKCQLPEAECSGLLSVAMTTKKKVYSGLYIRVTLQHQKTPGHEIKHELIQKLWKSGRYAAESFLGSCCSVSFLIPPRITVYHTNHPLRGNPSIEIPSDGPRLCQAAMIVQIGQRGCLGT